MALPVAAAAATHVVDVLLLLFNAIDFVYFAFWFGKFIKVFPAISLPFSSVSQYMKHKKYHFFNINIPVQSIVVLHSFTNIYTFMATNIN